jgi:hypothetical protein
VPGSRGLKVLPLIGDCLAARAYPQIQRNPLHGALPKLTTSAYHTLFRKHLFPDHRKGKFGALDLLADFQARGAGVFGTA